MLKAVLVDQSDGQTMFSEEASNGECVLAVERYERIYGMFYSVSRTTAGTTVIVSPRLGAGIVITDLIMSQDKANSTITIRFYDGTNAQVLAAFNTVDAPLSIAMPFTGKIKGWQNAWVEMVTSANSNAYVTVGFYHSNSTHTLPYTEWLAERTG
jgi:hypothetical protein